MFRTLLQVLAFCFPSPVCVWIHRLYGAKIGKYNTIHPGVLILAETVEIGDDTKIRLGTLIKARTFKLGSKSLMGYFVIVKGVSDLLVSDACVIGPRVTLNCERPIIMGHYSGVGPGSQLFTHGSLLPVTEGYRAKFGAIELKEKAWVTLNSTVGPGVTIGKGTIALPGTVLLESVGDQRMVSGDPAKFVNVPMLTRFGKIKDLVKFANQMLAEYCEHSNEYDKTHWRMDGETLVAQYRKKPLRISVNGETDIVLLTEQGARRDGMFFNIADLATDESRHPLKLKFDSYMRLYYGLTFLYNRIGT